MAKHTKICIAAAAFAAVFATGAEAGDYSNASNYNAPFGMQPGQENAPPSANFGTSSGASASGSGVGMATSGAGTSGASSTMGAATAIGNQLNVVTLGSNNTVVVNATQTNNGNQTATNTVNGH